MSQKGGGGTQIIAFQRPTETRLKSPDVFFSFPLHPLPKKKKKKRLAGETRPIRSKRVLHPETVSGSAVWELHFNQECHGLTQISTDLFICIVNLSF